MPRYSWTGIKADGTETKGIKEAQSAQQLSEELLIEQIALLTAIPLEKKRISRVFFRKKITLYDLSLFFEYLSFMLDSGVPIVQALTIAQKLPLHASFHGITQNVISAIEQGKNFSQSLESYESIFSISTVHLIANAEKTGKLAPICHQLANQYKQRFEREQQIKQALFLPFITLGVAVLLITSIFMFVMPQFETLYTSMGKQLPPLTLFMFSLGSCIRSGYFWGVIASLLILGITFKFSMQKYLKKYADRASVLLFPVYPLPIQKERIAFLESLALFLSSGIQLTQALENLEQTTSNTVFKEKIMIVHKNLLEGKTLAQAIQIVGMPFFDEQLIALLDVGQKSGNIAFVLERTANVYAQELARHMQKAVGLLPVLLILFTGLIIGVMMVAIYLPIFNLGSLLGT